MQKDPNISHASRIFDNFTRASFKKSSSLSKYSETSFLTCIDHDEPRKSKNISPPNRSKILAAKTFGEKLKTEDGSENNSVLENDENPLPIFERGKYMPPIQKAPKNPSFIFDGGNLSRTAENPNFDFEIVKNLPSFNKTKGARGRQEEWSPPQKNLGSVLFRDKSENSFFEKDEIQLSNRERIFLKIEEVRGKQEEFLSTEETNEQTNTNKNSYMTANNRDDVQKKRKISSIFGEINVPEGRSEDWPKNKKKVGSSIMAPMPTFEASFQSCLEQDDVGRREGGNVDVEGLLVEIKGEMVNYFRQEFERLEEEKKQQKQIDEDRLRNRMERIKRVEVEMRDIEKAVEGMERGREGKMVEEMIEAKIKPIRGHYENLAKQVGEMEKLLRTEFENKLMNIMNNCSPDNLLERLRENSADFDSKLRRQFEELNEKIRFLENSVNESQKKKNDFYNTFLAEYKEKFAEIESNMMKQIENLQKGFDGKVEKGQFSELIEEALEAKISDLRSEVSLTKNLITTQMQEIRGFEDETGNYFEKLSKAIKESCENVRKNNQECERFCVENNEEASLIKVKLDEMQNSLNSLKEKYNLYLVDNDQKGVKDSEKMAKELALIKQKATNLEKSASDLETFLQTNPPEEKFQKINALELAFAELSLTNDKSKSETGKLLEGMQTRLSFLESENDRLKQREALLSNELEEEHKKIKLIQTTSSIKENSRMVKDVKDIKDNRSETTNAHTVCPKIDDYNEMFDQFEDYREENSLLSHETENDIFFYNNRSEQKNNNILSRNEYEHKSNNISSGHEFSEDNIDFLSSNRENIKSQTDFLGSNKNKNKIFSDQVDFLSSNRDNNKILKENLDLMNENPKYQSNFSKKSLNISKNEGALGKRGKIDFSQYNVDEAGYLISPSGRYLSDEKGNLRKMDYRGEEIEEIMRVQRRK